MNRKIIGFGFALCVCLAAVLPAGREAAGAAQENDPMNLAQANQSDDPCYKVKQLKAYTKSQPGYKQAAGNRDPAYIQCHPLTITLNWEIEDVETTHMGTSRAKLVLQEEYRASLMVHYGWFDGLKQNKPKRYEILGPEPCYAPCPGKARSELLALDGQMICCPDQPYCRQKKTANLIHGLFQVVPADPKTQYAWLRFVRDEARCEGEIRTARLILERGRVPKGGYRFWDPFHYRLEIDQPQIGGIDGASSRQLSSQGLPTFAEIEDGLRTGSLTKVYSFSEKHAPLMMGDVDCSVKGRLIATFAFAPIEEERWRVKVKAWEKDNTQPQILYTEKGIENKVRIWVEINHDLTAEVVLNKTKGGRTFKSGSVLSYSNSPEIHVGGIDVCKCDVLPCPGLASDEYVGPLEGSVDGPNLTLTWPEERDRTRVCVTCKLLKSYLKGKPYREKFGSGELIDELHRTVLPLKNGYTKSGKILDWLKYTITLTKVK